MRGSGQVLSYVEAEILEAVHFLHQSAVDPDPGEVSLLFPPKIQNHVLHLVYTEEEDVVLAPN